MTWVELAPLTSVDTLSLDTAWTRRVRDVSLAKGEMTSNITTILSSRFKHLTFGFWLSEQYFARKHQPVSRLILRTLKWFQWGKCLSLSNYRYIALPLHYFLNGFYLEWFLTVFYLLTCRGPLMDPELVHILEDIERSEFLEGEGPGHSAIEVR